MAKIAVRDGSVEPQAFEPALAERLNIGTPARLTSRVLARGDGWGVADVMCTAGPGDRPFEELHKTHSIAIVLAGSFQYRSALGRFVMTPGSLMLGNPGQCFECGHEHAEGDRCLALWFAPEYFERLAADAGMRGRSLDFTVGRVPPLRPLSSLVAGAGAAIAGRHDLSWEAFAVTLVTRAVRLAAGTTGNLVEAPPNAVSRVTQAVRVIDAQPDETLTLASLARDAGLSPYHFIRTFERITGLTPHQYVLRTRLRHAAMRIALDPGRILDIALESGFGDVSNFNRAFRSEFGVSPRQYRVIRSLK